MQAPDGPYRVASNHRTKKARGPLHGLTVVCGVVVLSGVPPARKLPAGDNHIAAGVPVENLPTLLKGSPTYSVPRCLGSLLHDNPLL